jgi:hypothetical protein
MASDAYSLALDAKFSPTYTSGKALPGTRPLLAAFASASPLDLGRAGAAEEPTATKRREMSEY